MSHLLTVVPASCSTGWIDSGRRRLKPIYTTNARDFLKGQFAQQLLQTLCVSPSSGVIWWFGERIQRCTIILILADSSIKNNCVTTLCGVTFLQVAFMLTWTCTWLAFNTFNCTAVSTKCAAVWGCVMFFSFKKAAEVLEIPTFQVLPLLLPVLWCLN